MIPNIDSPKYQGQRKLMVSKLKSLGINNKNVLNALNSVPRHLFMDPGLISHSYKNMAYPIDSGQTISQPYTVAFQSELLTPRPNDKILEIGTGSGYQTAILSKIGCRVYSIERFKDLHINAKKNLSILNCNVNLFYGDGYLGLPNHSPFDKIIVTAGAPELPLPLIEQLSIGGILVIPIGVKEQKMTVFLKTNKDSHEIISEYNDFKFVPFLRDKS